MGKIGPKFSHLLTVRAEGADPPLTVSLTVKRPFFFDDRPKLFPKVCHVRLRHAEVDPEGALSKWE